MDFCFAPNENTHVFLVSSGGATYCFTISLREIAVKYRCDTMFPAHCFSG